MVKRSSARKGQRSFVQVEMSAKIDPRKGEGHCPGGTVDTDDLEPLREIPKPKNLEVMSIEALHEYIADLEAEIARAREMIAGKEAAQLSADSFFKKK